VDVTITNTGAGHAILLLHGGGGPLTVSGFATWVAADEASRARVITPTHPWVQRDAPTRGLADISRLAALYVARQETPAS
jgi:hypothetical protein